MLLLPGGRQHETGAPKEGELCSSAVFCTDGLHQGGQIRLRPPKGKGAKRQKKTYVLRGKRPIHVPPQELCRAGAVVGGGGWGNVGSDGCGENSFYKQSKRSVCGLSLSLSLSGLQGKGSPRRSFSSQTPA